MAFTVRLLNTPYHFNAEPTETVLEAALRQDVPMPWGCGGGMCGVCMGQVVAGEMVYTHPPLALFEEDEAEGKGLFCCGYARSDLVLDVPELNSNAAAV